MSLQLLTPVFAIIPCAPPSSGQPMDISGLVQIQPGADPASVEPSDYQIAFYAFTSQGFVREGSAPLTACGTWSMVGSNGYQYEAVVMQAGITPQGNYDPLRRLAPIPAKTFMGSVEP